MEAGQVITHPDAVRGLTPKLNWILDRYEREPLMLLDDDLTSLQRCFLERGNKGGAIRSAELVHEIILHTARAAQDLGAKVFGFEASNGAIRYYTGLKPMMLTGYINGCAMGFLPGHGLRYDTRIVAKNDFDICAMNAFRHRLLFKNCRYTFAQRDTFVGAGGQSAFRNSETEANDVRLLVKKYGGIFGFGGFSGTRKRDYAGVQKITMKLPY